MDRYTLSELLSEIARGITHKVFLVSSCLYEGIESCLHPSYYARFVEKDTVFFSLEHYVAVQKARLFNDSITMTELLKLTDTSLIKSVSAKTKNFSEVAWQPYLDSVLAAGSILKVTQNPDIQGYLLSLPTCVFGYTDVMDTYLGTGTRFDDITSSNPECWMGQNRYGFILTVAKDIISKNS